MAAAPFASQGAHIQSATASIVTSDISPPTVTSSIMTRTSMVSPMTTTTVRPKPRRALTMGTAPLPLIEEPEHIPALETSNSSHKGQRSVSSSSGSSGTEDDDDDYSSNYESPSNRSSVTSVSSATGPYNGLLKPIDLHQRSGSVAFSIYSPVNAGVFDDTPSNTLSSEDRANIERLNLDQPKLAPKPLRHSSAPIAKRVEGLARRDSRRARKLAIRAGRSDAKAEVTVYPPSPTLSEAEHELQKHLTSMSDYAPFKWDDVIKRTPVSAQDQNLTSISEYAPFKWDDIIKRASAAGPPPPPPPKSKRRSLIVISPTAEATFERIPSQHIASQVQSPTVKSPIRKPVPPPSTDLAVPKPRKEKLALLIPTSFSRPVSPEAHPCAAQRASHVRNIDAKAAESVILKIMESLDNLDDLFATAVLNKGFYRVFKRHELRLMRNALKGMSAPAWEHLEITEHSNTGVEPDSAVPAPDYDPTTYLRFYMRDMYIIAALKSLVLDKCQSLLRPETVVAMGSSDPAECSRVDDAFWRIWTFCKIFGSGKDREDDIVGQMDWLRGGAMVHQDACRATIVTSSSIDMSGVLLNAPDCFGLGQEGGLTAEQLYDMTEIWTCMGVLIQGLCGRTEQAREHGLFDNTEVRGGDIDGEELMLEEWYHYVQTLGLSTILDLATPSTLDSASAFMLANENGWMDWTPPAEGGSRRTFLREAVSRLYEEKIAHFAKEDDKKQAIRQANRQRTAEHAAEIRRRQASGEAQMITMSMDRPMSEWENVLNNLTSSPQQMQPPVQSGPLPYRGPPTRQSTVRSTYPPQPQFLAPRNRQSYHSRTSSNESAASLQHPLQRQIYESDAADNSSEKAVFRIVEMGFTAEQARNALRMTDMGDGLRVDRAVEMLLRE